MEYVTAAIIGYLLGSIPFGVLVARRHGVDLHAVGDGNPGAWNALEQLGARHAWPVFAGDGLKGLLAGLAGHGIGGWWVAYAAVAGAMVGHAAPAFDRLRGGKAVMTFAGGMFALSWLAALTALTVCVAVSLAGAYRYGARVGIFAHGARVGIFGFPLVQLTLEPVERVMGTGALMCLIGALFALGWVRRRSAPARTSRVAGPTT
jgi:glycerol-3-phosphate acyltransferase PlsY